jgi:glycerol-3-phosphate dehydrogenase
VEYRTDDARLTIEVIKAAVNNGAICVNYVKVDNLIFNESNKVCGAMAEDQLTGERFDISAKKVVNASGPWVDRIREMDGSKKDKSLRLTKGVHIVLDQSCFPLQQAIYFDIADGRMVFAIPRDGKTYVGTTDTFFQDDPQCPSMTLEDRSYLIEAIRYMFPSLQITERDIESSWAGVRPLIWEEGKDPSEISRKDEIWESDSGLLSIAGGKLTGYRKMAEMIVNLLVERFQDEYNQLFGVCQTSQFPISGGEVGGSNGFKAFIKEAANEGMLMGISEAEAIHLASLYGSNVSILFDLIKKEKEMANLSNLPLMIWAKLHYALEYEMVATPIDFFNRRISAMLFDIDSVRRLKMEVINYMAFYFEWSEIEKSLLTLQLESAIEEAISPTMG